MSDDSPTEPTEQDGNGAVDSKAAAEGIQFAGAPDEVAFLTLRVWLRNAGIVWIVANGVLFVPISWFRLVGDITWWILIPWVSWNVIRFARVVIRTERAHDGIAYQLAVVVAVIIGFAVRFYVSSGFVDAYVVESMRKSAPGFLEALYFSTVTMTTLGYGDFHPVPAQRVTAAVEAFAGLFHISILVALVLSVGRTRPTGGLMAQLRTLSEMLGVSSDKDKRPPNKK